MPLFLLLESHLVEKKYDSQYGYMNILNLFSTCTPSPPRWWRGLHGGDFFFFFEFIWFSQLWLQPMVDLFAAL